MYVLEWARSRADWQLLAVQGLLYDTGREAQPRYIIMHVVIYLFESQIHMFIHRNKETKP